MDDQKKSDWPPQASPGSTGGSPFYPLDLGRILMETEHALAFLDAFPVSPGHTLVVPRRVCAFLFDLPEKEQAGVWSLVARVRDLLRERYRPEGFNIGLNDGAAAGQTIPHAHVHLIPRYPGDCADPRGGIRRIFPDKAAYWESEQLARP